MTTHTDSTVLAAVDVAVSYDDYEALTASSFSVDAGELIAVVGPNGAGKSTLFKALAGFIDHDGDVVVHGEQCHHLERQAIAYIPQQSDVDLRFPISVAEVVMAGRRRFHGARMRPSRSDHDHVADCLRQVDLADMGSRSLATLSGGQVQRVLLARALAQEADVLLLDEAQQDLVEEVPLEHQADPLQGPRHDPPLAPGLARSPQPLEPAVYPASEPDSRTIIVKFSRYLRLCDQIETKNLSLHI